jgi:RNA recognition motif-containing protein
MSSTLYIDGLLASIGEQELTDMFSAFGNVHSVDIYKPDTAVSSGIGAVEMANLEDAAKAISALHRSYLGGNLLLVFHAHLERKTSGDLPGMVANQGDKGLRLKKPKTRLAQRAIPHKTGTDRTVISFPTMQHISKRVGAGD